MWNVKIDICPYNTNKGYSGKMKPLGNTLCSNEYIKSAIPGATITVLEAAHISNIEQPAAYTQAVLGFLR